MSRLRFLIDESLTPALALVARDSGYEAAHLTHLGKSGYQDHSVLHLAVQGDWTIVTNNRRDFLELLAGETLHPGAIILIRQRDRNYQIDAFKAALRFIGERTELVNCVIEVDEPDDIRLIALPPAT